MGDFTVSAIHFILIKGMICNEDELLCTTYYIKLFKANIVQGASINFLQNKNRTGRTISKCLTVHWTQNRDTEGFANIYPQRYHIYLFFLRGGSHVAQSGLDLAIFLPQPPKCSDYKCVPPCLASQKKFKCTLNIYFKTVIDYYVIKKTSVHSKE
jgi:hypothetical protein